MTESAIEIGGAVKVYGIGKGLARALDGVSLDIRKGEFFTLLGPSGCGKTTLLRLIAGFESPTEGTIRIGGQNMTQVPPNKRPVNTVFQSYALFPHLTARENIAFGLQMLGRPREDVASLVERMMALVRLKELADRRPGQLSGGQQQRVALARALAPAPQVLLLDEPLSALDLKLRKEMQLELKRLQTETGITFVFVTHDQEEALTMSDRIGVMNAGRLLQVGAPREIYNHPVDRFVADFVGETNFIPAEARGDLVRVAGVDLALPGAGTGRVTLAARPEQVRMGGDGPLPATVTRTIYFGTDTHCHMILSDGTEVVARLQSPPSGDIGLKDGQGVRIDFAPGALQILGDT